MRLLLCAAVALSACKGSSSSAPPSSVRFLPGNPDIAFRADVQRIRAWSIYPQLAPVVLGGVEMILANAKTSCDLDVMATAKTIIAAKKGTLMAGDVTLIIGGLPRDKMTTCLDTIVAAKAALQLTRDGDLFHATLQGRAIASGAILPTGELLLLQRAGMGIEAAAWKTEINQGANAIPAWWSELEVYANDPIAIRATDGKRVVLATATFTDALTVRAKILNATEDDAKRDQANIKAIYEFMKTANAGEGKVDAQGTTLFAELTAKGPQIDALIKTGGAALFPRTEAAAPTELPPATSPRECSELTDAVGKYMQQAIDSTAPANRAEMAAMVGKVLPALQKAYVDACTSSDWSDAAIECHVLNATNLPKFEKCRMGLPEAQRTPFDKAVGEALAGAK